MSELEATFYGNVPFKNNFKNLIYHTSRISQLKVTLNASFSSKSFKLNKILAKVWRR